MFNLEHEIEIKENKKLINFIGIDYFHDSIIKEVKFINKKHLEITIFCIREWDINYQKDNIVNYKNIDFEDKKYTYTLIFKDCIHFEINNSGCYIEYINGRFKNSELVKQFNKSSKKKYLHLRIELSEGFADIIFSNFDLRRTIGKLSYPYNVKQVIPFEQSVKRFEYISIKNIRKIATQEGIEQYYAIQYLMLIKDNELESIALKNIDSDELEVELISIVALGTCSKSNDLYLKLLNKKYTSDNSLYKKTIDEVIEKIITRIGNK